MRIERASVMLSGKAGRDEGRTGIATMYTYIIIRDERITIMPKLKIYRFPFPGVPLVGKGDDLSTGYVIARLNNDRSQSANTA